jgi:nucleotide-binding universal stress UspA family protein
MALYPSEVPQALALSAWDEEAESRGQAALSSAQRIAMEEDCILEGRVLPTRDAAGAILDEAAEWAARLVVMAKPHRASRGDAASHVLERAPCSVLVLRPGR